MCTAGSGPRDAARGAAVGVLPDAFLEGDGAEEWHAQAPGRGLGPAMAEDLVTVPAARAHIPAHVLDQTKRRHVQLAEHLERLDRDIGRDVLRRADDRD